MEIAKAWVFKGSGRPLELQQVELPMLDNGEVLVKNVSCSICKSDLHTFMGHRPGSEPSVLGHEILGEIVTLGSPMIDYWGNILKVGDLVTWSLMASCGKCRNCKSGIPQKCMSLKKYGHEKMDGHFLLTGGFASHTHLYPGTAIYKLSDKLPAHILAGLNCSWATVAAAIRIAGHIEGKNVLITGAGMLGVVATMMCREKGASKIVVVEQNESRLEQAALFGADVLIPAGIKNDNTVKAVKAAVEGEQIDLVFEMTGSNKALELGLDAAGIGTTIVLAGSVFPTDDVAVNPERIVRSLLQIKGIHNYTPQDLADAIEFIHRVYNEYPLEKMFDERIFNLDMIDKAVEHSIQSPMYRVAINF